MGGTFDPIHIGHMILAEQARSQFGLDEVLFMPSSQPPHKDRGHVSRAKDREAMTKLAIVGNEAFRYSDLELKREGLTYTSDTLLELCEQEPQNTYYFILGADSLFYIDKWHEPQVIFDHAVILVSNRDEHSDEEMEAQIRYLKDIYHGEIGIVHMDSIGISSTEIREKQKAGISIRYYVPEAVYQYIQEEKLYVSEKE